MIFKVSLTPATSTKVASGKILTVASAFLLASGSALAEGSIDSSGTERGASKPASQLLLSSQLLLTENGPLGSDPQDSSPPQTMDQSVGQDDTVGTGGSSAKTAPKGKVLTGSVKNERLEGRVSQEGGLSPLLFGTIQTIPTGTKIDIKVCGNLNSELAQKGDEVWGQISTNIQDGNRVFVPGGWLVHGHVTDAGSPHRNGRAGYVEVQFDKLVRPDADPAKQIELPFDTKFSTHDKKLSAVGKVIMHDTRYAAVGAYGGALLAFQLGGVPLAISTYGIDIGVGAGIGAGIGLYGAYMKKGDICSYFPGDEMHLVTSGTITLPGFNPTSLPSAETPAETPHLNLTARNHRFAKDSLGDKLTRELTFDATIYNGTARECSFFDLSVLSDHGQRYFPHVAMIEKMKQKVAPHSTASARLTFNVGGPERKYRLVLMDRVHNCDVAQADIN
jgi:hypothetical protein